MPELMSAQNTAEHWNQEGESFEKFNLQILKIQGHCHSEEVSYKSFVKKTLVVDALRAEMLPTANAAKCLWTSDKIVMMQLEGRSGRVTEPINKTPKLPEKHETDLEHSLQLCFNHFADYVHFSALFHCFYLWNYLVKLGQHFFLVRCAH